MYEVKDIWRESTNKNTQYTFAHGKTFELSQGKVKIYFVI